jgi:hypothetical protein
MEPSKQKQSSGGQQWRYCVLYMSIVPMNAALEQKQSSGRQQWRYCFVNIYRASEWSPRTEAIFGRAAVALLCFAYIYRASE